MKPTLTLVLLASIFFCSCNSKTAIDPEILEAHHAWQKNRLERLKSESGWLNLAGLFWLEQGTNTFGSSASNKIIFPGEFPSQGGTYILTDSMVVYKGVISSPILVNDSSQMEVVVRHDGQKERTRFSTGTFRWYIVKRGERYGIRLRDLEHPRLDHLDHIPAYPYSPEYVIKADYIPYEKDTLLKVPTVIDNFFEEYKVPGELRFKIGREEQVLLPFKTRSGFFLIVGDATNGLETYGAGRFLSADSAVNGKVTLNFNRAYNPPCAFSPFATCPIPPPENMLDIKILAGEKAVHLD